MRLDAARWCPAWMLPGLGILHGQRGAPRCPVSVARAAAAHAWRRRDCWGPPPARREQQRRWDEACRWARTPLPPGVPECAVRYLEAARRAIRREAHAAFWNGDAPPQRGLGGALYVAMWMSAHGAGMISSLAGRSAGRRWGPSDGGEWALLAAAPNYAAAHHVLRLLLGGLPGAARWRPQEERQPRLCGACGGQASWAWATGGREGGGVAWCRECAGPWHGQRGWAALPQELLPEQLRDEAAALRAAAPPLRLPVPGGWRPSRYGACPLCGLGEAGAEHLLSWCPAVALAWRRWAPGGADPCPASLGRGAGLRLQAVFAHQVAYLHSTLLGRAALTAGQAAGRLVRACAAGAAAPGEEEHGELGAGEGWGEEEDAGAGEEADAVNLRCAVWGQEGPECAGCGGGRGNLGRLAASAAPAAAMRDSHGGGAMARWPTATAPADAGHLLAVLRADSEVAGWLPPGAGWWPRPRCVEAACATAAWGVARCPVCGMHAAQLRAVAPLTAGAELTVAANPSPSGEAALWPLEATFDGGSRHVGGRLVAGAGATLWRHRLDGPPVRVASAVAAVPRGATAQVAEALGCRLALGLLLRAGPGARAARVVGDSTGIVRYCAGTARLRRPEMQAHLDVSLASLAEAGWRLSWQAVRRRLNEAADGLATEGERRAAALAAGGRREVVVEYRDEGARG